MPQNGFWSLLGRVLLSAIFVISGFGKIFDFNTTAHYMANKGIPATTFVLVVALIIEIVGGLSVLLGVRVRWGALLLAAYLVPVTLIFHNFWSYHGAPQQMMLIEFLKNLAIMGGLLVLAVHGAGEYSVDSRWRGHTILGRRHASV
jgi:putative oxidoreductase